MNSNMEQAFDLANAVARLTEIFAKSSFKPRKVHTRGLSLEQILLPRYVSFAQASGIEIHMSRKTLKRYKTLVNVHQSMIRGNEKFLDVVGKILISPDLHKLNEFYGDSSYNPTMKAIDPILGFVRDTQLELLKIQGVDISYTKVDTLDRSNLSKEERRQILKVAPILGFRGKKIRTLKSMCKYA